MNRIPPNKEDPKSKAHLYWILGIVGIIMIGAWSYFDPGDRVFFDDQSQKARHQTELPTDTTAIEHVNTPSAHSTHFH